MKINLLFSLTLAGILCATGCKEDKLDLYERPDWLTGKIYTQILDQPDLSLFAKCISLTGYEKILDVSGSYTVFCPTDEAFTAYLQQNSFGSVEEIPLAELDRIVKFHIVQNPWSKQQLQSLDVYGWIDELDKNNNLPRGFKRQTILRDDDIFFGVKYKTIEKRYVIVDSTAADFRRRVINDTRKYAPFFFREYFNIYNLKPTDYEFYFSRLSENINDLFFAGGRIVDDEIFAENGYIYRIDRVIEPLKSAYQILSDNTANESYSKFLNLIYEFPHFIYNQSKTFKQPDAALGLQVDSLFDITFPQLAFNICNEDTRMFGVIGLPPNVTIRYHHGLIAPTNQAVENFESEFLIGGDRWGSFQNAPEHIKRMFVNTHMSVNAIYPSDFSRGYFNGESDFEYLNPSTIVQKQFGSNSTFIGVNQSIVPRAFKSITGPVYLQRGYSIAMNAIESTRLLPALKRQNEQYSFFVEPDALLLIDSSLVYNSFNNTFSAYILSSSPESPSERVTLTTSDVRTLLLNHVAVEKPKGVANKEFIRNMAGNHLIFNNLTGEVRGTRPTTPGFNGDDSDAVIEIPLKISINADNGDTYRIGNWFSFSAVPLYSLLSTSYQAFHKLLVDAGLANEKEFRYTFISENDEYTVFAPTAEAIAAYNTTALTKDQLRNFVLMHFVKGDLIFTDGNKNPGYYLTERIDEKSTSFLKVNTKIYINPGTDMISIPDKEGGTYISFPESSTTNLIVSQNFGAIALPFMDTKTSGVIHQISKVLDFNELNTSY